MLDDAELFTLGRICVLWTHELQTDQRARYNARLNINPLNKE